MQHAGQLRIEVAEALEAEHICLESDEVVVGRSVHGKRVGPSLTVASRFRRCETELVVLDGDQLGVRTRRPRQPARQYVVDLRFVDVGPVTRRHVAWRWWQGSFALGAVATTAAWHASSTAAAAGLPHAWLAAFALAALTAATAALALYRTYETVSFVSVHGRAILAEIIGNLGCRRACAAFSADVGQRILDARRRAPQSKQQFLRDELREHRRLLEDGALADEAYEAGKRRILAAHA